MNININPWRNYWSINTNLRTKSVYVRKRFTTCTKSVYVSKSRTTCVESVSNVRKSRTTCTKAISNVHKIRKRTQSRIQSTQSWMFPASRRKLMHHATPWKRIFPTNQSLLDQRQKDNRTHNSGSINGKVTACVTGQWWHAWTFGSNRSNQWRFDPR